LNKRLVFPLLILLFLIFVAFFIYYLYRSYKYATTDAVFVQADTLVYASFTKVNGRIVKLYKKEGDEVKEGEVLAELEPEDYRSKVLALSAEIERVRKERESLEKEAERIAGSIPLNADKARLGMSRVLEEMRAVDEEIAAVKASLEQAERDRKRYEALFKEGLVSRQSLELVRTQEEELKHRIGALRAKKEALAKERQSLEKDLRLALNEERTVLSLRAKASALAAQEESLSKQLEELKFYYLNTKLESPVSGIIAKKFRSVGDVVSPGQPVFAIVDPKSFYVLVLLEENKLKGVVKGAPAKVRLDSYPDAEFEGEVEEVLAATAATFALVPRDISAGEFTKLAQRVPVKIRLKKGPMHLLRVGLGGEVEIKRIRQ